MKKNIVILYLICGVFLLKCSATRFDLAPVPGEQFLTIKTDNIELPNTFDPEISVKAIEHVFNYNIELVIMDSLNNQLLLVGTNENNTLKNKPIFLFDADSGKIVWKLMSLAPGFNVYFNEDLPARVIFKGSNKVFGVDRSNGQIVWKRLGNFIPLDYSGDLAYTKGYYSGKMNRELYHISDGNTLWKKPSLKIGWWATDDQILGDSTWLVAGDGLYSFDLETGKGWQVEVPTHATGGVGRVVAVTILAVLSGSNAAASTDSYDYLTSNALVLDDQIYYAGNRIMVCVDAKSGQEIWRIKVPKIAAHSLLKEEDDHILMVGLGWCYKNYIPTDYSIPYIARFSKEDGKQLLYVPIGTEKRVDQFLSTSDGYYFLSEGKLVFLDYSDPENNHSVIEIAKANKNIYGDYTEIINDPQNFYFIQNKQLNTYKNLKELETPTKDFWVRTSKGIIQYNEFFQIKNWIPNDQLHFLLGDADNIKIIRTNPTLDQKSKKSNEFGYIKLIDTYKDGLILGEIKVVDDAEIYKDKLYIWGKKKITILPLYDLIENFLGNEDSTNTEVFE